MYTEYNHVVIVRILGKCCSCQNHFLPNHKLKLSLPNLSPQVFQGPVKKLHQQLGNIFKRPLSVFSHRKKAP